VEKFAALMNSHKQPSAFTSKSIKPNNKPSPLKSKMIFLGAPGLECSLNAIERSEGSGPAGGALGCSALASLMPLLPVLLALPLLAVSKSAATAGCVCASPG